MQRKDKIILQKILIAINEATKILENVSKEEFL